jgi:GTP cyclohydrolase IA
MTQAAPLVTQEEGPSADGHRAAGAELATTGPATTSPATTGPATTGPATTGPDGQGPGFDAPRIERAVREILIAIGEDPDRDGLRDTPARVARAYAEQFAGLRQSPQDVLTTVFDVGYDEMVIVKDIEVYGTCEHHLVPFIGVAHIGYIPNVKGQITGLSKLARLVDVYARRPQVQERMTCQIADALMQNLEPRGVIVVIECEHLCMTMRGVRKPGARTVTSAVRGAFLDNVTRAEAMSLIYGHR